MDGAHVMVNRRTVRTFVHRRHGLPPEFGPPISGRDRLRRTLAHAERNLVARVVADGGIAEWRQENRRRVGCARRTFARSGRLARSEAARLLVALADRPMRDSCWLAVDSDPDAVWPALWLHLSRRALPPYRAEPLFLLAWSAWRAGQPSLARAAAARSIAEDPDHRGAALLLALLHRGPVPDKVLSLAPHRMDGTVPR
jgi:Domain of unknown function (DUF4192)